MQGIVIGKFMPFHRGHEALMRFALENRHLHSLAIIICSLPSDPISVDIRYEAINLFINNWLLHRNSESTMYVEIFIESRELQQEPNGPNDQEFWKVWTDVVRERVAYEDGDAILFASDEYGLRYAKELKSHFLPFNVNRTLVDTSGTKHRSDMLGNFHNLSYAMQKVLRRSFVIFGAESNGKTTLVNYIGKHAVEFFDTTPEYARDYLQLHGPELTSQKWSDIIDGQTNLEKVAWQISKKPFIVHDTDLLTTYGWANFFDIPKLKRFIIEEAVKESQHEYFLLRDDIPFEEDPQRYGGDKRQTNMKFWEALLLKFDKKYTILNGRTVEERFHEIMMYLGVEK